VSNSAGSVSGGVIVVLVIAAVVAWQVHENPNDERTDKFLKCWNAFVDKQNAANTFWVNYAKASTDNEKRVQLRRCREAWERVEPFEPVGVDPRLADAIAGLKKAWMEDVDFTAYQVGVWWPDRDRSAQLSSAITSARERVDSTHNQIASELGGIENVHHN
jgi:hypothetical protein